MTDQTGGSPWWHSAGGGPVDGPDAAPNAGPDADPDAGPDAGPGSGSGSRPGSTGDRREGFGSAGASWQGSDPSAQAAAVLGTVAQEAGRLIAALQERLASPTDGPAIATGSAECLVCPVCRAIAALRTVDPEAVERLTAAAAGLVATVRMPSAGPTDESTHGSYGRSADGEGSTAAAGPEGTTGTTADRAGPSDGDAGPGERPRRPRSSRPTRPRAPRVEKVALDDDPEPA